MKVVVFVTQKGGSGKSTLAMGCAVVAWQNGHKVFVLDTDKQGTLGEWYAERKEDEPQVDAISANKLEAGIKALRNNGYEYVFIDTPGVDDLATTTAIRASDLCVVPTRTSPADVRAFKNTLSAIMRLNKDFVFVLSQTPPRGYRIRETMAGASMVGSVCDINIVQRNDHQDAIGSGYGVTELHPDGKAAEEVRNMWQWIKTKLERVGDGKTS